MGRGSRRSDRPARDRRDDLVTETAAIVAAWFGRVVVYEDGDLRGRCPGEMTRLITAALEQGVPG